MKLFEFGKKPAKPAFGSAFFRNEVKSAHTSGKHYPPDSILKRYRKVLDKALPEYLLSFPAQEIISRFPREDFRQIIESADKVLGNELPLFRTSIKISTPQIDWHYDYLNRISYPLVYIWDNLPAQLSEAADPVNGWDIARFHQLYDLALAYLLTSEEKYAGGYFSMVTSFMDSNPFCKGINWYDGTEVCLRGVNLMLTLPWISRSVHFGENLDQINTFLLSCLLYIQNIQRAGENDYRAFARHNFLLLFSRLYKGDSLAGEFFEQTVKRFRAEAEKQILKDGSLRESSTAPYWHLAESVTLYLTLANIFDLPADAKTKKLFEKLLEVLTAAGGSEGKLFRSGKIPFSRFHSCLAAKYNFSLSKILSPLSYLLHSSGKNEIGAILLNFFTEVTFEGSGLPANDATHLSSAGYTEGGKYFLRSRDSELYISIRSSHSDLPLPVVFDDIFSYELRNKGESFIVNPGVCSYFKDLTLFDKMRSAWHHNTFLIDNTPSLSDGGTAVDLSKPKVVEWNTTDAQDNLVILNHAYVRLPDPVICKRGFFFDKNKNKITIKDEFIGGAYHQITSIINIHPDIKIEKSGGNEYLLTGKSSAVKVKFVFPSENATVILRESFYSPEYNILHNSSRLVLTLDDRLPAFYIIEYTLL